MAIGGALSLIMSLLGSYGQQGQSGQSQTMAGMLGRDTSDRSSTLNLLDPGGGFVDKRAAKARGLSTGKAIGANILDPTGFMGLGKGKKKQEDVPTVSDILDEYKNWQRAQPEYQKYAGTLEGMTPETGYGSISPDWGDILERTLRKTREPYRGSATTTGLYGKAQADVARRGFTDSPAFQKMMMAGGAQEAQAVGDVSGSLAQFQAAQQEAARLDYLNRIAAMADMGTSTSGIPSSAFLPLLAQYEQPQQQQPDYSGIGSLLARYTGSRKTAQTPQQTVAPMSQTSGAPYQYTGAGSLGYAGPSQYEGSMIKSDYFGGY